MAFVANTLVLVAVTLLYRYADLVTLLGGTELHLGLIVGIGMVGSLVMRLVLGTKIDQYGPRRIWLISLVLFALVCVAHLGVTTCHGPLVYLLRIAFSLALAGVFSASTTFVAGRASVARMAEMIGMLGASGFLGMLIGAQLGDFLCAGHSLQRWHIDQLFIAAAILTLAATAFAAFATDGEPRRPQRRRPPAVWILRRYQPGPLLLVGVALGVALSLPSTFLPTMAAQLHIPRIGLFFTIYSITAILTRVFARKTPERIGLRPMILWGLGVMTFSQLLFLPVTEEWQFVVPGLGFGLGQAVLYPTIMASGNGAFPKRYRGLATTLMMATFDAGQVVGAPAAGLVLHYSAALGLPQYPTLFAATAAMLAAVGSGYALASRAPAKKVIVVQAAGSSRPIAAVPRKSRPGVHSPVISSTT